MRILFILMLVANVGVTLVSLVVLPDRVAIHFGADGVANVSVRPTPSCESFRIV